MKPTQWALFSSGIASALLVSTAYQSPIIAQNNAQVTAQDIAQLPQLVPAQTPTVSQANTLSPVANREPTMAMPLSQDNISVQIENMTPDSITYQALGDTEPRTLEANASTTLEGLHVPATVTFSYIGIARDRSTGDGLTKASVSSKTANTLHLVIQPTDNLDTEVSNLTVESNGNVFVF